MQLLDGKVAIIAGASSGMGAATARLFAAQGARVVLGARSADALAGLADEVNAAGGAALAVPTDATDRASAFSNPSRNESRVRRDPEPLRTRAAEVRPITLGTRV